LKRRLKLSSQDLKYALVFALIATIVTSSAAYLVLNPAPTEQFFAMWILGANGLAEDYYPNDNPNLAVGEPVNWTLGVYNHMGGLEYVVVRVKLLNSTSSSPDELAGIPNPTPEIFEFDRILVDNDTWSIPFVWKILNLTQQGQNLVVSEMSINQTTLRGNLGSAASGNNFRFVFELWFYDETAGNLTFSWNSGGSKHSVWTQIWFNATVTS
jgi:uncharacterized membrane protein